MGVYIDGGSCVFKMKKEDVAAALTAAKGLVQSGGYAEHYAPDWREKLLKAPSIDEFLRIANGWITTVEDFNITGLHGEGEQSYRSEDEELFNALAPFVEKGCYIDIETSDFQKFRLAFNGKTCERKEGELDYDNNIGIVEAILKDKKMLPMLIGVHPVLDERIHEVLKG